ncbi:hypothetical protein BDZ94DRAFT_1326373 [Collybia nuda]|uniref:Uncharacterized protein n=1 Tax=Collybia nuda TaxID=64659 RepID=A0A9P5XTG9_9AGAR|nr:hypothetical protein BDZ94DRAFT_1326373 [Collybia nuda]
MSFVRQGPLDPVLLDLVGDMALRGFAETCIFSIMYGMFVVLFGQITITYLKRKKPTQAQRWMFIICVMSFLLFMIHGALEVGVAGAFVYSMLVGNRSEPLVDKIVLVTPLLVKLDVGVVWMRGIEIMVSDTIVVWRAFALLNHRRGLVIMPFILLLGCIGSSLLFLAHYTMGRSTLGLFLVNYLLSLATNVAATGLIGYIYWYDKKNAAALERHGMDQAAHVLALLMESGAVFCVFQTINIGVALIFNNSPGATNYWSLAIAAVFIGLTAMYPTMVIALVNSQYTLGPISSGEVSFRPVSSGKALEH